MKSNYEERKANRLAAYESLAAKNETASEQHYENSNKLGSQIPFGQPILVGHHSEKRHRKDIEKIHNEMSKSVEAQKKADYYKDRAEAILNGTAISSDDPNAIDKLTEKLEKLQAQQEIMKAVNKIVKKAKISQAEKVTLLMDLGLKETTAIQLLEVDRFGRIGVPSYKLTNNNAVIRNTRQRIEYLEKLASIESSEEVINGITLKVNSEDNRVQIFFPGIPAEETRKMLKGAGFHWAPSVGAWMRQISNYAIYQARQILNAL